ncbi:MAG: glycosyltransferase [Bacilli bacterium]|nr:glycosyltransferase [Bacilli bacterium]
MKIMFINSVIRQGSTGNIAYNIARYCFEHNNSVSFAFGRGNNENFKIKTYKIGSNFNFFIHCAKARLFDKSGLYSSFATKKLLKFIEKEKPDLINIHNLHGYYLNIKMLLNYLLSKKIKVVITLHDCWLFTGHCAYFDYVECDKWLNCCGKCPCKKEYPKSILFDNSKRNFLVKKNIFEKFDPRYLSFVSPSNWLIGLARQSFLKKFSFNCIPNGVDTNVFKHKIKEDNDKFCIIGVAHPWTKRKGLSDYILLSRLLPCEEYSITLIGLSKKQIKVCTESGIIGIGKVGLSELTNYYQKADLFVNFTYEDNYPTVNLEAISCGTPVLTYDTGGSKESALNTPYIIKKGDVDGAASLIQNIKKDFVKDNLFNEKDISSEKMCERYLSYFYEKVNE